MSDKSVVPFQFHTHQLRIIPSEDGLSFWAVAKDVTDAIDIRSAHDAVRYLPDAHKGTFKVRTPGGDQELLCISESGLYRLILRSNKPEAEPFTEWVTSEVLPQIRRTGAYQAKGKPALNKKDLAEMDRILDGYEARGKRLAEQRERIEQLTAQLKTAHAIALGADHRLGRIAHYHAKGLNPAEISKLTDIPETTTRKHLKRLIAAGVCFEVSGDLGEMLNNILLAPQSGAAD